VIEGRDTGVVITVPLEASEDSDHPASHWGHRRYSVGAVVPLTKFIDEATGDDSFTVWTVTTPIGTTESHRARVGVSRYVVRRRVNEGWAQKDDRAVLVSPYYTFKAKNLSIYLELFNATQLKKMLTWAKSKRSRPKRQGNPVWLIGEQVHKAQDTGVAFFTFLREKHPEIDAYYVIGEGSPDRANLDGLDNVVEFRSAEHIELFFRADRIVTSHHPEYIYPSKSRVLKRSVSPVRVFLQHGVFGVRRLDDLYGRDAPAFHADLFLVSSEREKRNAITDLGYKPEEVAVTGLSRFDTLFDGSVAIKPRQILVMPTWREWLQSEHSFRDSEYFDRWNGLLNSPELASLLDTYDAEIVFHVHPNMRMFAGYFAGPRVRIVQHGEQSVQHLLKESAVLITDYSSVGFDFSFLSKPVLYYQFDSESFLSGGSHIDLDAELPGLITWSRDALLDELEDTLRRGGTIRPEYQRRADSFAAYHDTNSCERIFDAVAHARKRSDSLSERYAEVLQVAKRVLRERKRYIPVMQRVYKAFKLLPMDKNLIVFESSLGRRMNDSPKALYDELVRRGDTRTKVWIQNGKAKVSDQHSRVVPRLSIEYFWYLARAKYWVTEQNLPHYVTRRSKGVYLQTWHGTPLKRMLHDIEVIHGRDEGYLERVSQAVAQWSHLISPSAYATTAFASAFRHQATVLEVGYPRNDSLLAPDRDEVARRIRRKLGVPSDKKTVLYAPTFRDDDAAGGNRFFFNPPFGIEDMAEALGTEYVLLVRLHSLIKNKLPIPEGYEDRIIDVSSYADLNELFLAGDALITDYSSLFFDYSVLRRPIVFFPYDLEKYRDELRGFYLDYDHDLPGPIVTELDALSGAVAKEELGLTGREEFLRQFAPHEDGQATKRVVDEIFGAG